MWGVNFWKNISGIFFFNGDCNSLRIKKGKFFQQKFKVDYILRLIIKDSEINCPMSIQKKEKKKKDNKKRLQERDKKKSIFIYSSVS